MKMTLFGWNRQCVDYPIKIQKKKKESVHKLQSFFHLVIHCTKELFTLPTNKKSSWNALKLELERCRNLEFGITRTESLQIQNAMYYYVLIDKIQIVLVLTTSAICYFRRESVFLSEYTSTYVQ